MSHNRYDLKSPRKQILFPRFAHVNICLDRSQYRKRQVSVEVFSLDVCTDFLINNGIDERVQLFSISETS